MTDWKPGKRFGQPTEPCPIITQTFHDFRVDVGCAVQEHFEQLLYVLYHL
jgi:hypothetical protein